MHWITNDRTKKYTPVDGAVDWSGDWKERFPVVRGEEWAHVYAFRVWAYDMVRGMPYVYDLCRDGMMATILSDSDLFSDEDVAEAKKELRRNHDVVTLRVLRVSRHEGGE